MNEPDVFPGADMNRSDIAVVGRPGTDSSKRTERRLACKGADCKRRADEERGAVVRGRDPASGGEVSIAVGLRYEKNGYGK
jgi:hypothetical protein